MKGVKKSIFFAAIICSLIGCGFSDMERAKSRKIIGNLYVINLNIPEDSGFYIIFRNKPAEDKYLLKDYEYVDYLEGNDSILLVKTRIDSISNYHLIEHDKGDTIFRIENLSVADFLNNKQSFTTKYYFNSNSP